MADPGSGFAFLAHTSDIGIRAWGPSLADAFAQAGLGVAVVMGMTAHLPGRTMPIHAGGIDLGGVLVAFLDELVFVLESAEGEGLASLAVSRLTSTSIEAVAELAPISAAGEGIVVKAATYHQLEVSEHPDGSAEARVYLDV